MFDKKINELSIDNFIQFAKKLSKNKDSILYIDSYDAILHFTNKSITQIDDTTLIALAHMVYGWMPTMLKHTMFLKDYSEIVKRILNGENTVSLVNQLSLVTNNSVVGASKLLHFINPEDYGIFDSRVYKSITNTITTDANNANKFVIYTDKMRELIKQNENNKIEIIKEELINKNYLQKNHTSFRALEVCLYAGSQ